MEGGREVGERRGTRRKTLALVSSWFFGRLGWRLLLCFSGDVGHEVKTYGKTRVPSLTLAGF